MSTREFEVRQAVDRLPTRRLAVIGGVAVTIGISCVVVSWALGRAAAEGPIAHDVLVIAPGPLGTVERDLTTTAERGEDLVASQKRRLASYGWVDRKRGIAHIPIDRAIDVVAGGPR